MSWKANVEYAGEDKPSDDVNHPEHYKAGNIETYDYIEAKLTPNEFLGYIKGNVLKYISRSKYKDGLKDLRKAQWYLNRYLEDQEISKEKKDVRLERSIREHLFEDIGIQGMEEDYMSACQECLRCAGVRL